MTSTHEELFELLSVSEEDRAGCAELLAGAADLDAVAEATTILTHRLGSFDATPIHADTTDPMAWLTAYLRLTPTVVDLHRDRGISADVTHATLADFGRNLALHRRSHGEFGCETWDWLVPHFTGMMFSLGRLNFMMHAASQSIDGLMAPDEWVPSIHIPESGPLSPAAVDESLAQAQQFFSRHFPDKPIAVVTCVSWLLDPYLLEHMPDTNIGSFARRFIPTERPYDDATAALFFLFRTRDIDELPTLPRDTTLRRLVLDRADSGEPWQIGSGYLRLEA